MSSIKLHLVNQNNVVFVTYLIILRMSFMLCFTCYRHHAVNDVGPRQLGDDDDDNDDDERREQWWHEHDATNDDDEWRRKRSHEEIPTAYDDGSEQSIWNWWKYGWWSNATNNRTT